jgi:hypothetical protein
MSEYIIITFHYAGFDTSSPVNIINSLRLFFIIVSS